MAELEDTQVVNYFARNAELTSKVGLCNSLYNCCTLDRVDVDAFYPRSYDLTSPHQATQFVEDFQLTTCRCLLRRFLQLGGGRAYPAQVIEVALNVCRRQVQSVDDALDEAPGEAISAEEWSVIKDVVAADALWDWSLKTPGKRLEAKKTAKAEVKAIEATLEEAEDLVPSPDEDSPPEREESAANQALLEEASRILEDGWSWTTRTTTR
eukprot:g13780.t1